MSDCDCQKKSEPTVDDVKKPIGDVPLTATIAATTVVIFFGLRIVRVINIYVVGILAVLFLI